MSIKGIGNKKRRTNVNSSDCSWPACTMAVFAPSGAPSKKHARYCRHHLEYLRDEQQEHRRDVNEKIEYYKTVREECGEDELAKMCDRILKTTMPPVYLLEALFRDFNKVEKKLARKKND